MYPRVQELMFVENPPQLNVQLEETIMPQPTEQFEITDNIWVEMKSPEGEFYYYHATSRVKTWTMPEGPNVKIMPLKMYVKVALHNLVMARVIKRCAASANLL